MIRSLDVVEVKDGEAFTYKKTQNQIPVTTLGKPCYEKRMCQKGASKPKAWYPLVEYTTFILME